MNYAMFFGVVGPSMDSETLSGQMTDRTGDSIITELKIEDDVLSFTKTYHGRPSISYKLRK